MIGPPYTPSDGPCLDGLAERADQLAADPVVAAIARGLATPARIVAFLCGLPQTDDDGIEWTPGAVSCGNVWQRTRSPADATDPNCWERLAWFAALMQVIRPDVEIRFSTWTVPGGGLHVGPMLRALPALPGWPLEWTFLDLSPGAYPSLAGFVDLIRNAGPQLAYDGRPPLTDCTRRGCELSARNAAAARLGPPGYRFTPDSEMWARANHILDLANKGWRIDPRYLRAAQSMVWFYEGLSASVGARNATDIQNFLGLNHVIGSIVLGFFGLAPVATLLGSLEQNELPAWAGGNVDKAAIAAPGPAAAPSTLPTPGPAAASAAPSSNSTATASIASLGTTAATIAAAIAKQTASSGNSPASSATSSSSTTSTSPSPGSSTVGDFPSPSDDSAIA